LTKLDVCGDQGSVLNPTSYHQVVYPNRTVASTYRVDKIRQHDGGVYSCEARNQVESPVVAHFNVEVHCESRNTRSFPDYANSFVICINFSKNYSNFSRQIFFKNFCFILDPPEVKAEHDWVHAGLGSFTELVCNVHAQPPAQVSSSSTR
jgi:hypothetical protein